MKTFYIKTFGCQMNVYDGQRISATLVQRGLHKTENVQDADLIILNTCSVREKASNKVFSALGRIRDKKKPEALFGIIGCVAREAGADAFRRIPELNFVLGPQSYHKLPQIIENPDAKLLNIDLSGLEKFDELIDIYSPPPFPSLTWSLAGNDKLLLPPTPPQGGSLAPVLAYIPIQEGCDHCCTYCIVPYTRGRELSRPFEDVMKDVHAAADNGAVEICFLGQNVNGYRAKRDNVECGMRNEELSDLIRETAKIESIRRLRFTSSYPTEMTDELIGLFRSEPKLLPFVNMPIQSGSPDVLTRMNRPYSVEEYVNIIDKLRAARPDVQISSDFIVGFPGETDADFEATLEIAKRIRYINSYTFKYSPRPHTAAALMPDQIPENIKRQRLKVLDEVLTEINREFNESCIGMTLPCLIEGADKTGKHLIARTPYMQQVVISEPERVTGTGIVLVKITSANKCSLRGHLSAGTS